MKPLLCTFIFLSIFEGLFAQNNLSEFISDTDTFLKKYTREGRVNYVGIAGNMTQINKLIDFIAKAPAGEFSENEKTAFYINAYNLLVINQIIQSVKNSSGKSTQSISGFFDAIRHRIAGEDLTLNELEQKKLILRIQDPRIHFVLVCAARGCPKIADFAFRPDQLDTQLEQRTQTVLEDPDFIRVSDAKREVAVSEIFTWYREDFLKKYASIRDFINAYRSEKLNPDYELVKYTYDWSLNN